MSAFRSRIFWKALLSLALGLLIWLPIFFWLTVPLINRMAYEVEESAGRTVLDNVVQIVGQSHRDLEAWRQTALEAHRRELKNIVLMVESWTKQLEAEVAAGTLTQSQARERILERLRLFRYGNNDYVWAADYRSVLISHPVKEMHGRDASALRDAKGNLVIPPMVQQARKSGEGYFSYWWARLDNGRPAEKLSYFRDFPNWQLVIGTGVYIDDVEQEVARRRAAMLEDLRKYLHGIKVANSGYIFVMDGEMNAIVHPDPQLEGKSLAGVIDSATGKPLGEEFIEASRRPNKTLAYRWSRPDDPEKKAYDKVAWIDYFPEYDWYLGASAYAEDLGRSGHFLAERILVAFVLGLFITALIALAFIRTLTAPILHLAEVARRNMAGDLSAVSEIRRSDEIGVLAEAFDSMVGRLKEQIETLEQRVEERTHEIAEWAVQLEALVSVRTAESRASEAKFRGLVEQSMAGIFVVQDGFFSYANAGFARIFSFADPADVTNGVGFDKLAAPQDRDRLAAIRRSLAEGEVVSSEFTFVGQRRDGKQVDVEVIAHVCDYEKRPAIIGIALDITKRKRAEAAREVALAASESL
jgi:PAS domain S-box-containing protein